MKRILFTLTVLFSVLQLNAIDGRIIFVQIGSNGQGISWDDAMGDLQDALLIAKSGDQIWVASGIYTPTTTADRNISFIITDGIQVYGGFAGGEVLLEERNIKSNQTILSGEIGAADTKEDNSYTIVLTKGVSLATIVDGFTITDGMANGLSNGGEMTSSGAGWFNDASALASSPTIINCSFTNNFARDGGAIYNYAESGECRAVISACTFIANHADFDGGAIYNNGNFGICNPSISDCVFLENNSYYGAGILNKATRGEAITIIDNCIFAENISMVRGSAIYCYKEKRSVCDAFVKASRFEGNASLVKDELSGASTIREVTENSAPLIIRATVPTSPVLTPSKEEATSYDD